MDFNDKRVLIIAYLLVKIRRRRANRRRHRCWVRPILQNRKQQGFQDNLTQEMRLKDLESYKNFLRMSPKQYNDLLHIVGPRITKIYWSREPISPSTKLSLTIRYLASGDSMMSLMYAFRIGKSTVSKIISECLEAIWDALKSLVLKPPSKEQWRKIGDDYGATWNFPNCLGALDGKHVVIKAPPKCGSTFYNYKGQHSIVLMAVCDANYCFTLVDIGASGRQSDGGIFKNSVMGQMLEEKILPLPDPSPLNNNGPTLPCVFVGDEAFQLTTYMLRPFPRSRGMLSREKRVFKYRLSRARRVIENVFGILVAKWNIFKKPICATVETTEKIIKATVVLHNYLRRIDACQAPHDRVYFTSNLVDTDDNDDGEWRTLQQCNMFDLQNAGSNNCSRDATAIRTAYMNYFCNEGAIPWQWDKADNFNF